MFDKTIIQQSRREYVPFVQEIKRAPTDESVALLKEFESKIREKIVDTIVIGNNFFDGACLVEKDELGLGFNIIFKFTINGEKYIGHEKLEPHCDTRIKIVNRFIDIAQSAFMKLYLEEMRKAILFNLTDKKY